MKRHWLLILGLAVALIVSVGTDARAQTTREVELSWDASPSTGVTYNIYRSEVTGGCVSVPQDPTCVKLNPAPISGLTFTDTGVPVGKAYFYTATAFRNTLESIHSVEVEGNLIPPEPPTNLQIVAVLLAGLGLLILFLLWRRQRN